MLHYRQKGNNPFQNNAIYYQCTDCKKKFVLPNKAVRELHSLYSGASDSVSAVLVVIWLVLSKKQQKQAFQKIFEKLIPLTEETIVKHPELDYFDTNIRNFSGLKHNIKGANRFERFLLLVVLLLFLLLFGGMIKDTLIG